MTEILYREFVYIWYYFDIQLRQIIKYWIIGILIGSAISVFAKSKIHSIFTNLKTSKWGTFGIVPASFLGILSPLCMYGTIPIAASFYKQGMRQDWLAAFMMSSILLNPQLIIYSMALGNTILDIQKLDVLIILKLNVLQWNLQISEIEEWMFVLFHLEQLLLEDRPLE